MSTPKTNKAGLIALAILYTILTASSAFAEESAAPSRAVLYQVQNNVAPYPYYYDVSTVQGQRPQKDPLAWKDQVDF